MEMTFSTPLLVKNVCKLRQLLTISLGFYQDWRSCPVGLLYTYSHKKRKQKNILAYLGISKRCPNVSLEQADDDVDEVVRDETTETLSEHSESLFRVSPTLPPAPPALATGWWWCWLPWCGNIMRSVSLLQRVKSMVNNLPGKLQNGSSHYDHRWPYLPIVLLLTCFLLLAAAVLRDIASDPVWSSLLWHIDGTQSGGIFSSWTRTCCNKIGDSEEEFLRGEGLEEVWQQPVDFRRTFPSGGGVWLVLNAAAAGFLFRLGPDSRSVPWPLVVTNDWWANGSLNTVMLSQSPPLDILFTGGPVVPV